jgi:hypothetical protein
MMRLRDCVSLLGFVSLGISIVSAGAPSMASTRPANAIPARTVDSAGMSGGMKAPAALRLNLDGRDVVTIYATGDVQGRRSAAQGSQMSCDFSTSSCDPVNRPPDVRTCGLGFVKPCVPTL